MRRFFVVLFLVLLLAAAGGAWYVYDRGFTRKWRVAVAEEFRQRDIELTLKKLTLDPFRGIVAKEIRVYDTRDRKRVLAVVDEMRLVINYANLLNGKTFLDALDLHDATLALPLNPQEPAGAKLEIRKMSGRLFLPPQQVYLSSFEAEIYGIRVTASGRVVNPQVVKPKSGTTSSPETMKTVARVIAELQALRYEGEAPTLDLRFSGDLAVPETVFVEAKLWAEQIRRGGAKFESLYLDLLYRDQQAAIRQLALTQGKGVMRISGHYDFPAKSCELDLHSNIDPQPLIKPFVTLAELDEFHFVRPPELEFSVNAAFGDSPEMRVVGRVEVGGFRYRQVSFQGFRSDLVWDGERWAARNVKLSHQTGELSGDVMQVPGDFRTRMKSSINPEALAPFLQGSAAEWFKQLEVLDSPTLSLEMSGPEPDPEKLSGNGALRLGRTAYRNVWANSATATLRYTHGKLEVDPLRIIREEGSADGALTFDFLRNEVQLRKVRSSLHPQEIVWWIDRNMVKDILPYRFGKRPPNLVFDGLVHTKGGNTTQLRVDVDGPGGMDYTFLRRELHASKISARLDFADNRMKISNFDAVTFGGHLKGSADVSLKKAEPNHSADLRFENMDFAALTKLYFGFDDSKGRMNARYGFSIRGDDAQSMRGRGELAVTDGKVFAIPFLGPLSYILNGIVPGMGDDVARKGSATFTIENGVIDTRDFLVEAKGFSMIGDGKLFYLDDRMNFDVRINARGLPGVLLFPVSKLFEYTATDSLSKPNWRPKMVPRL